jgi:hypothetical protein
MRASLVALATVITCAFVASSSQAGWTDFWHRTSVDFHRNNCWPKPFVEADRNDVRVALDAMVRKGWQSQNTLTNYHFDPQTNQLTVAAHRKIEWILTQNPPPRRVVFVLRSLDQDITAARVDAVQQTMARIVPHGVLPMVAETENSPLGRSADYIVAIHLALERSVPSPHLPAVESGDGG